MNGTQLRAFRQALGLSQAQLAALLDIHPNVLARWERSELTIRHPTILRLALERLHDIADTE